MRRNHIQPPRGTFMFVQGVRIWCFYLFYLYLTMISFILSPLHRKHGDSDIDGNNADDDDNDDDDSDDDVEDRI